MATTPIKTQILKLGRNLVTRLWIRPALYCIIAIVVVVISTVADRYLPDPGDFKIEEELIESLLGIMASSMLVVVTFSVSVLIAGYINATATGSPRAFDMVVADSPTKQALSSFLGAFIFSVVGYVGIGTGLINGAGRLVMMAMTLWIFLWVVGTLVYWIDHVARLGQVRSTIRKVARHARQELAKTLSDEIRYGSDQTFSSGNGCPIFPDRAGVLQDISIGSLSDCASRIGASIRVTALRGDVIGPADPLCQVDMEGLTQEQISAVRACFLIGSQREPHNNVVLSLRTLSEIASRALSPGVNDPGTAIDVLDAFAGVFARAFAETAAIKPKMDTARIYLPSRPPEALLEAAFEAIGRDGARQVEVVVALQNALRLVGEVSPERFWNAVEEQSLRALEYAKSELPFDWEKERVENAARQVGRKHEVGGPAVVGGIPEN